jgi:hypothetical protein
MKNKKTVIMAGFGGNRAEAFTPTAFARRLHNIAQTLSVFGQQAKVKVDVATYMIEEGSDTRARVAKLHTPKRSYTRKATSRRGPGRPRKAKRSVTPAQLAGLAKARRVRAANRRSAAK